MGAEPAAQTLIVYSRRECHLCDELLVGLRRLQGRIAFEFEIVDVDRDAALERRYGNDVPVLVSGERELCRHRLDERLVTDYLVEMG